METHSFRRISGESPENSAEIVRFHKIYTPEK